MANPEKLVTRELVFETADRLKASGVEPSNRKIFKEIGGGSMTTIANFFREWRAVQDIAPAEQVEQKETPQSVLDAMAHATNLLWQAAQAEARHEIEAITEQANQRVKDAEGERDKALTELADAENELTAERERAQQEADRLTAELDQAKDEAARLAEQLAQAQTRATTAEARASELEKQTADLQAERNRLHTELEAERERSRIEASKLHADLEQLRTALATAIAKADATEEKHQFERKRAAEEVQRQVERFNKAETERDHAMKEAHAASIQAATMRGELETLKAQNAALLKSLAPAKKEK